MGHRMEGDVPCSEPKRVKTEHGIAGQQWHLPQHQQQLQDQKQQQGQGSEGATVAHTAGPAAPPDSVQFAAAVPVAAPSGPSQHETIDLTADSDAEDSQGEAAAEGVAAAEAAAPAAAAAASAAAAAAGDSTPGLTLGQLKERYKAFRDGSAVRLGCKGLSCLARLLSGSESDANLEEMQVSALLPHMGMLLQHWQQRFEAWGGQTGDFRSGSSASTPALHPNTGACYVGGMLLLLKQRAVAQQFAGPEQQQQVLQQLETARAQFNACCTAIKEVDRAQTAARTEAAAAAPAASAAVPRRGGRSGPYILQQLCDDLASSRSPEAQQQLQLVTAWVQAITGKSAGPYNSPLAPVWLGRDPKLMLVRDMLQRWEPLKQHILGFNSQTGKITNAAAAPAAQQQLACVASLLQLPQVAAAVEPALLRQVQGKVQGALTALSEVNGCQAARQRPQATAAAAAAAGAGTSGLTLGQLKEQYMECRKKSGEKNGCRAFYCLARLLSGPSTSSSVDEVQVSTLLPHMGVLLQHWQQRVAGGDKAGDVVSGSSASTPALLPSTGACYVRGILRLLEQPVAAQQFSGPEQQQQVLAQLTTALAQFEAAAAAPAAAAAEGTVTARTAAATPGGRPLKAAATPAAVGPLAATTAVQAAAAAAAGRQPTTSPAEMQQLSCTRHAAAVAVAAAVVAAEDKALQLAAAAAAGDPSGSPDAAGTPDVNPTMPHAGAAAATTAAASAAAAAAAVSLQPPPPVAAARVAAAPTAAVAATLPPAAAPAPPAAAAAAAAAGVSTGADTAPAAAAAGSADPPLRAAERYLLQLYRAHLAPGRDQLLRFRQAMRGLGQLQAGHQALVDFWADYEVRGLTCVCVWGGGGGGGRRRAISVM